MTECMIRGVPTKMLWVAKPHYIFLNYYKHFVCEQTSGQKLRSLFMAD